MIGSKLSPWLFRVQPYADESFSHFLGRFRRANHLSHQTLAELLCALDSLPEPRCDRTLIQAWETPSRRCQPTASQLAVLAQLTQIEVSELSELLPPKAKFHTSTRLCSQCYQTEPIHRLSWQLADSPICGYHHRLLLSYALVKSFLTKPKSPKVFPDNSFSDILDFRSGNIELF